MSNTQQVGWWNGTTNVLNGPVVASLPQEGEAIPRIEDFYQEAGDCKGSVDCLAQRLGSSLWVPLAAAFGGLKILDAGERRMKWEGAVTQVKQGEACVRSGHLVEAARMMGEASAAFHELDETYPEALTKQRQGDILRDIGYGRFVAMAQEAYDRTAMIYSRLIEMDNNEGFKLIMGFFLEKAGRPDEAAEVYGRMAERYHPTSTLRSDIAFALVKAGRYKEAIKAIEECNEVKTREGIKRTAAAVKLAREASKGRPEMITAPAVFMKWERAREAFYDAARLYRSSEGWHSHELEALALDGALDAARWAAAVYNGPGYDNRLLQAQYLREKAITLGGADSYKEASAALDEEAGIRTQIKDKKGLAEVRALRREMLAKAAKDLKEGAINIKIKMLESDIRILAIRQFVSPPDPRMFRDASSIRSGMGIMAELLGFDNIELTINRAAAWRDRDTFRDELKVKKGIDVPLDDWRALVRTARFLKNAGVNILVRSFDRFRVLARLSLDERRRFAEAWFAEYARLSQARRADYGEPRGGEILPAKFVSAMVARLSTISLDGGRPVKAGDVSVARPAAADFEIGKNMGGIAGPAKRGADKEGREAERISGLQVVKAARAAFSSTACKARKR